MKDLIILAADKSMEHVLKGVLGRPDSLEIRPVSFDIFVHPERDPGCARSGVGFLNGPALSASYRYGLLVFDYEGCGRERISPLELEENLNAEFALSSWKDRAQAIGLVPELESWVWRESRHLEDVVGWKTRPPGLYRWPRTNGWLEEGKTKPDRPKEAFEAVLRQTRKRRSASLYLRLAGKVSLAECNDRAFQNLTRALQNWFRATD